MPIHEKHLIRPENLKTHDRLVIDGVDVSGHWSTFIEPRVVTDYNEALQDEIAALPGGDYIHRCFQCGSCTNACPINALNPDFSPRYWIYLIRMGMESELLRDKDIIWQCVSCNRCTYACPRDVEPEGVMKATAHWLELKGHTKPSPSAVFDDIFSDQVIETGKIEESRIVGKFLMGTKQALVQDWIVQMVKQMIRHLPIGFLVRMGLSLVFRPRTSNWSRARAAIKEYVGEQETKQRRALGLEDLLETVKRETEQPQKRAAE